MLIISFSYEIGHEGQRLIKKLDSEGTFFKDIKKRSKELQKYDMDEIRTELKEFAKNMKAEKKRNRLELGSGCLEMYKTCVSNWEKNRSSAEKIRKVSSLYLHLCLTIEHNHFQLRFVVGHSPTAPESDW